MLARLVEERCPPSFAAALREATRSSRDDLLDTLVPMLDWLSKDDAARGEAVRQLMRLGDTIMRSARRERTGPLAYPVLARLRDADVA